jgi:chromosome segregation protein
MIEEALGLKIYQYKKTESLKKLDVTEENIAQVESLRREIAPHIKFLKRQVEKVEKAKELRNELMVVSRQYLKWESEYIQTIQQDIKHKKGPIEEELRRIQDHIERCKQILAREAKDSKRDELMVLEEKMSHTRGRLNECIHDEGRIEGEISAQKRLLIKQKELIQSQSHKTVELRAVEELHVQVQEFLSKLELTEDISIRKHILDSIKNLLTSFTQMHRDTVDVSHISDIEQEIEKLVHSKETISQEIATLKREETHLSGEYQKLKESIEKEKDTNRETEKELFTLLGEKSQKEHLLQTIEYEERTIALREEEYKRDVADLGQLLGREVLQFAHDPKLTDDEAHQHERKRTIERIKIKLEDSPAVGSETIKEYEETVGRDQFLEKELTDLMQSKESLRTLITDLDQKIVTEFTGGVDKINNQFKNYFSLVFGGGEASLEIIREIKRKKKLDDLSGDTEEDEEEGEEGVDIQVSLPKKKVKSLMMLSGGERALTSIALLFAMSQVNPPPFIILDETDAALDEANSRKYGDMIEYLSKVSQLIVITHNRETMSRAGSLFGITMGQGGVSKLLSVSFEDAVTVAK